MLMYSHAASPALSERARGQMSEPLGELLAGHACERVREHVLGLASRQHTQPAGVVMRRALRSDPSQEYFLYVPTSGGENKKLFVTVHGISRNAEEHAGLFAAFAEQHNVVMLAPAFPAERFPDYQRLGRVGRGARADLALAAIVNEVADITGARVSKLFMFGYSGGAQFVNRYAFAYPERVARAVLGAAGWYTFPDYSLKYPEGIRPCACAPHLQFDPAQFLKVPMCVLVGDRDQRRNAELRVSPRIDALQGATRLERGQRWMCAMTDRAARWGFSTAYEFQTMPRSGHSFAHSMRRGAMGERTFAFLFAARHCGAAC